MKKINNKGFVLAETLVVTVFLMVIFAMLYSNYYPLIGEYERRENYDDVDSKYSVYWIKKMVEDGSYKLSHNATVELNTHGFTRFRCTDIDPTDEKDVTCKKLVKSLEVSGCDSDGNNCDIFITRYRIGSAPSGVADFKNVVKGKIKKYEETCIDPSKSTTDCINDYKTSCLNGVEFFSELPAKREEKCTEKASTKVFSSGMEDYILSLPDYKKDSLNLAKYRVIASFHHTKDNNNYYTYATIEVNRQ